MLPTYLLTRPELDLLRSHFCDENAEPDADDDH